MSLPGKIRGRLVRYGFAAYFRPTRTVPMVRLGSAYGGWWVPEAGFDRDSVCYLAGVGTDITFDLALVERFGCRAWGLDPTPRSGQWVADQPTNPLWTFEPVGVAGKTGEIKFFEPADAGHVSYSTKNLQRTTAYVSASVMSVRDLMTRLGHDRIDLLKLDVEGAEHDTLRGMLEDGIRPRVLCVEFDQPEPVMWSVRTHAALRRAGYELVKLDLFNLTYVLAAGS
jgi:FkbM family methyltransferase